MHGGPFSNPWPDALRQLLQAQTAQVTGSTGVIAGAASTAAGSTRATVLHSQSGLQHTCAATAHMQFVKDPPCQSDVKPHEGALTVLDARLKLPQVVVEPVLPLEGFVVLMVHHVALPQPAQPRRRHCLQHWQRGA